MSKKHYTRQHQPIMSKLTRCISGCSLEVVMTLVRRGKPDEAWICPTRTCLKEYPTRFWKIRERKRNPKGRPMIELEVGLPDNEQAGAVEEVICAD